VGFFGARKRATKLSEEVTELREEMNALAFLMYWGYNACATS